MILDVCFETSKLNTSTGSVQDSLTGFAVSPALEGVELHLSRRGEIVGRLTTFGQADIRFLHQSRNMWKVLLSKA
jgi:hypothetical protein